MSAAASVVRMMPYLRHATPGKDPLIGRGLRIVAVAISRANGHLEFGRELPKDLGDEWSGGGEAARHANLEWSIATLRKVAASKKNDPTIESELGEALARVDAHKDVALTLLGSLAERDLLTSPQAYAALASLRGEKGDAAGKLAALQRCQAMTKDAGVCGAPNATPPSTAS
jgi:hypothetical protein